MHKDEAEELNRNVRTVGYHEWVDIPNGLVYQSCCDCGLSHSIMVGLPDADAIPEATLRVRFLPEPELTEATRESEKLDIPLYREVKRLREENQQLKHRVIAGLCREYRRKYGGDMYSANTMHAGWDVVFDAESILKGEKPFVVWNTAELIETLTRYISNGD